MSDHIVEGYAICLEARDMYAEANLLRSLAALAAHQGGGEEG